MIIYSIIFLNTDMVIDMWRTNAIIMVLTPKECSLLFNGNMSMIVRKSMPKKLPSPFKVYVYQKKHKGGKAIINEVLNSVYGGGKVIGEFVCDKVIKYGYDVIFCAKFEVNGAYVEEAKRYNAGACLSAEEMYEYSNGKPLYGGHITEPKRYDAPKELSEFSRYGYQRIERVESGCGNEQCGYCEPAEVIAGLYKPPMCRKGNCIVTRPPQSWMYCYERND